MRLWSTELGANLAAFRGHLFPVWDCAAGPGGQYLASASADRTARVWSTERAQSLRLLTGRSVVAFGARVFCVALQISSSTIDCTPHVSPWTVPSRCGYLQVCCLGLRAFCVAFLLLQPCVSRVTAPCAASTLRRAFDDHTSSSANVADISQC